MTIEQLSWIPETREDKLEKELERLKEKSEKMRKALFARHGSLNKAYDDLKYEFEMLKEAMVKIKPSIENHSNDKYLGST